MDVKQAQPDLCNQVMEPEVKPAKARPGWRGPAMWGLACAGGGGLLIAAVLVWGYSAFGSLSCTLAYLNGERLLVDPGTLSFGAARRGEERDLQVMLCNRTGKEVKLLGAKSTCGCMTIVEKFPLLIADGSQQEVTIRI